MSNDETNEEQSLEQLRDAILHELKQVIDPELHINVVDLGLIYRVDISDDRKKVELDFTLTTPGCPLADVIEDDTKNAILRAIPKAEVITNLVWTPMWNVDFMSEDARLELGFPI